MKQISFVQAEHQNKKKVTRRERFLAQVIAPVPWQRQNDALSPSYFLNAVGKRGRPPIALKRMLRIYFLKQGMQRSTPTGPSRGLIMREGSIGDATIVAAAISTQNKAKQRDPEMEQAKRYIAA